MNCFVVVVIIVYHIFFIIVVALVNERDKIKLITNISL